MTSLEGSIVLVTGIMAAGKSTVSEQLAIRLDRSVHLRGDVFRKMIVNGRADMSAVPGEEALRQLELRYELAVSAAMRYARDGYTVIYQDVVIGKYLTDVARKLRSDDHVIVLCPSTNVVTEREASRKKSGYRHFDPGKLQNVLQDETERIGCWIDNSNQMPDQTVDYLLQNLERAQIGNYFDE